MMSSMRSRVGSWLAVPRPNPAARLRLFCFPYAGGGASVYYGWPRGLPTEVELLAVQPPGRESRIAEAPVSDPGEMVDCLARELAPHLDLPFAFFGHSVGAVMAFELARRLRRAGRALPLHLFVSGRHAPQLPSRRSPLHALPEADFVRELRRLNGTPEEILQNRELMELVAPLLRADFAISETYAYREEPPLEVPISAYGGLRDPDVERGQVAAWREQTSAAFQLRMFPGDHFFIHADRALVLEELSRELAGVLARLA